MSVSVKVDSVETETGSRQELCRENWALHEGISLLQKDHILGLKGIFLHDFSFKPVMFVELLMQQQQLFILILVMKHADARIL